MKTFLAKARMGLCIAVMLAFFLPGYNGFSGLNFISLLARESDSNTGLTMTDVYVVIVPLLLVPFSALYIFLFSAQRIPLRRVYVSLPLIFFLFFTCVLFTGERSARPASSLSELTAGAGPGFFLAFFGALLLPFTKNRPRKRYKLRRTVSVEAESEVG